MRLLIISHLYPNEQERRYGIFRARHFAAMAKLGADLTVLVPQVWAPRFLRHIKKWEFYTRERPVCEFPGVQARAIPYLRITGNWWYRWDGLSVYYAVRNLAKKLHQQKPFDMVFSACLFPDGDAAWRLGDYLGLPAACLAIGTDVNLIPHYSRRLYSHFEYVTKKLDGILAHGQSNSTILEEVTGKKVPVIQGCVNLDQFCMVREKRNLRESLGIPVESFVLIFAGYLTRNKGVYEMIEAVCDAHDQCAKVYLAICGNGIEEGGMKRVIQEKGAQEFITLVGTIDPDEMPQWMKAADALILATHYEGMPNVVMEAMACGLPVISTRVGGLPAAVGECEGAILLEPKQPKLFTEAIVRLAQNSTLCEKMGAASRRCAEEKFGVMKNAQQILDHLRSLL